MSGAPPKPLLLGWGFSDRSNLEEQLLLTLKANEPPDFHLRSGAPGATPLSHAVGLESIGCFFSIKTAGQHC